MNSGTRFQSVYTLMRKTDGRAVKYRVGTGNLAQNQVFARFSPPAGFYELSRSFKAETEPDFYEPRFFALIPG